MAARRLRARSRVGLNRGALTAWLAVFFIALAVPAGVLIYQAYDQLKWEAFYRQRVLAEELSKRIDTDVARLVQAEEARSFADYAFLVVAGDPSANFLQRSALSSYPVPQVIPGLIGYFQVDASGGLTTPLLPASRANGLGVSGTELTDRQALEARIHEILLRHRLVLGGEKKDARVVTADRLNEGLTEGAATSPAPLIDVDLSSPASPPDENSVAKSLRKSAGKRAGAAQEARSSSLARPLAPQVRQSLPQAAFDQLKTTTVQQRLGQRGKALGRVEDLELDPRYAESARPEEQSERADLADQTVVNRPHRRVRKERNAMPAAVAPKPQPGAPTRRDAALPVRIFESELDPFEFSFLGSGHVVLYRKVWRDGKRYIQGALIEQAPFLARLFEMAYRGTLLSGVADLAVAYHGDMVAAYSGREQRRYPISADELNGALLLRSRVGAPLDDLELVFSMGHLPAGPGARVIFWVVVVLVLVLCGGFYSLFRLGAKQIALVAQQQDFISAVSHELRTPLTSIRMYAEMLREGWGNEEKKQGYYAYILDESERLSRLISNVLQLARMTRNDLNPELAEVSMGELVDQIGSKVSSQIERDGFQLELSCDSTVRVAVVKVDADYFSQILINLVDNALKFAAQAEPKKVDIQCTTVRSGLARTSVVGEGTRLWPRRAAGPDEENLQTLLPLRRRVDPGDGGNRNRAGLGISARTGDGGKH